MWSISLSHFPVRVVMSRMRAGSWVREHAQAADGVVSAGGVVLGVEGEHGPPIVPNCSLGHARAVRHDES